MASDEELMVRYRAGDRGAFNELFERYAPLLLRVMQYQLYRREDARDLVQQTFLQLHRSRADFRPDAKLRPWLLAIAFNLKRRHLGRVGRELAHTVEPEALANLTASYSPSDALDAEHEVRSALAALPPEQREVIVLHWLAGLPFAEVANLVGASLAAVKVRAHRGYAAIREQSQEAQLERRDSVGDRPHALCRLNVLEISE